MQSASTAVSSQGLLEMATAFWMSRALHVVAKLGIADVIGDHSVSPESLAERVEANAEVLARILRALASVGVFSEDASGCFRNTDASLPLKSDVAGSLRSFVIMLGEKESWRAWEALPMSVHTGQSAFEEAFGAPLFRYLQDAPDVAQRFDEGMVSRGAREDDAVRSAFDFSSARNIVDVGGGRASLLARLLDHNVDAMGTLFELPSVIASVQRTLHATLAGRLKLRSGDMFVDPLPSGADHYILKKVLHNWPDDKARQILLACRAAMPSGARLLIVESIMPPGNEPSFAKWLDLFMLVWPGGRERTKHDYQVLLASAGLRLTRIIPAGLPLSIIEASTMS